MLHVPFLTCSMDESVLVCAMLDRFRLQRSSVGSGAGGLDAGNGWGSAGWGHGFGDWGGGACAGGGTGACGAELARRGGNIPVGVLRNLAFEKAASDVGGAGGAPDVDSFGDHFGAVARSAEADTDDGAGVSLPPGVPPEGAMLYNLVQVVEESSRYVASAASYCSQPADESQVLAVADAAEQAAQRAAWAASIVYAFEPSAAGAATREQDTTWVTTLKAAARQASMVSEAALQSCRNVAGEYRDATQRSAGAPSADGLQRRSKVMCKFFERGLCHKGDACTLSHDPRDREPRPLTHKRSMECRFFTLGKCTRGDACAYAHGSEELDKIVSLREERERKERLREEVMQQQARPGDWRCGNCQDLQFARNATCRRCGAFKPDHGR
eukprot:TRINITY_DN24466_c0_g1_i1.p2 TRINITY_DN24466_c0_g1~~TRINITY_DN24466_c0_g1_i1.p2  ORF type:complete len:384 (+),score=103.56 TRINITY_DN24466_c0_g1_i1:56-1207(+)